MITTAYKLVRTAVGVATGLAGLITLVLFDEDDDPKDLLQRWRGEVVQLHNTIAGAETIRCFDALRAAAAREGCRVVGVIHSSNGSECAFTTADTEGTVYQYHHAAELLRHVGMSDETEE